jgi:non-heme chloroperoxidase
MVVGTVQSEATNRETTTMKTHWKVSIALALLMSSGTTGFAGQYVRVSADLELYYDEIFVTGWTGTNESFIPYQLSHFSQKYHVIAYDPRSHGRSSKTLQGNTYAQHGQDLHAFMDALKLKDAVVVGWSYGCEDVYGYFRT